MSFVASLFGGPDLPDAPDHESPEAVEARRRQRRAALAARGRRATILTSGLGAAPPAAGGPGDAPTLGGGR